MANSKDYNMEQDLVKAYMQDIKQYPVLSHEEQKELVVAYKNGDLEARQKLLNSNLRLVVAIASKFQNKLKSLKFLDIIQEGNLGLMRALETYEPEKGAFSTYAHNWIYQKIDRIIKNANNNIRTSVNLQEKKKKYMHLLNEYEKAGLTVPEDDEVCEVLEITKKMLSKIRDSYIFDDRSLNQTIKDDEASELEMFVDYNESGYKKVENDMDNRLLFLALKENLSSHHYYILYHTVLKEQKESLESIAQIFNISRERVKQLCDTALIKAKIIMNNPQKHYQNIINKYGLNLEHINPFPIEVSAIVKYLYVKDNLDEIEQRIYCALEIYKDNIYDLHNVFNCTEQELLSIKCRLKDKIKTLLDDKEKYIRFKNNILKTYGTKIFEAINDNVKVIDYDDLSLKYSDLNLDELIFLFSNELTNLQPKEYELLIKYFSNPEKIIIDKYSIEKYLNLALFGYKHFNVNLPSKILYETLQKYSYEFTEEQCLFLECFYFNKKDKSIFEEKYPNRKRMMPKIFLIEKLERLYFNINRIFENNFNKNKYLLVREKLSDKQKKYLDLFYGINCEQTSIKDISIIFNEEYTKTHGIVRSSRETAINIYCNKNAKKVINKNAYIPYVINPVYGFTKETRRILKMYLIEDLSYEEISQKTDLTKYRISNIITDGLRKIDFYRFKITEIQIITQKDLTSFFENTNVLFSDMDKKIIILKFLEYKSNDEISNMCNIPKSDITKTVKQFNEIYNKYLIKEVSIDNRDIMNELYKHFTESVLTEEEKEIIALHKGLKSKYNQLGKKHTAIEISELKNRTKDSIYDTFSNCFDKLKLFKIGKYRKDLNYINRDELNNLLDDPYLPITEKEKTIICSLLELKDFQYKTLKELGEEYNETANSMRRRYQRAIVNIRKYQNNEIEGYLTYETIKQYLKYFSRGDKTLITEFYKNNLTYEQISKKHNLTFYQVVDIFDRIKVFLYELTKNQKTKKFDFDFYDEAIKNPKLPFYGDLDTTIQIFDLLFAQTSIERKNAIEIKKELNLELERSAIIRLVYNLMVSVEKLKMGIEKNEPFSYSQILNYYENNCNNMSDYQKARYEKYFKKMTNPKYKYSKYHRPTNDIIFDLIKDTANYIELDKCSKEKIISLLRRKGFKISKNIKQQLMYLFNIRERDLMNGKDIKHVYRILEKLQQEKIKTEETSKQLHLTANI